MMVEGAIKDGTSGAADVSMGGMAGRALENRERPPGLGGWREACCSMMGYSCFPLLRRRVCHDVRVQELWRGRTTKHGRFSNDYAWCGGSLLRIVREMKERPGHTMEHRSSVALVQAI